MDWGALEISFIFNSPHGRDLPSPVCGEVPSVAQRLEDLVADRGVASSTPTAVSGIFKGVCARYSFDAVAECLAAKERRHRVKRAGVFKYFNMKNVPEDCRVFLPPLPRGIVVLNSVFLH